MHPMQELRRDGIAIAMGRIKLHEQPSYEFTYTFTVQARDLSSWRHLGSDGIVVSMHEALISLLQTIGLDELDLGDGTTGLITRDTAINFIGETFLCEGLVIESNIDEISPSGFRIFHRMRRSRQTIALAESNLIGFDYANRTPAPIPEAFHEALLRHRSKLRKGPHT